MRRNTFVALLVVAGLLFVGAAAGASDRTVLRFTDIAEGFELVDLGPPWQTEFDPSPGDMLIFDNLLQTDGADAGRFRSICTVMIDTHAKCAGTLQLENGTIELAATVDFAALYPIKPAVTGGTGAYRGAGGQARITLTDVEGVEDLVVYLTVPN